MYSALPKYCQDIEHTNPNSTAIVECTDEAPKIKFKRVFICYGASAMGFSHCLPILDLDGTHLKNKYQGILLAATAVDANNSLFPLAYAVVDAENDEHWLWFLQNLHRIVGAYAPQFLEPAALTLLSDRQKGLLDDVAATFPNSPHGYCLRHLEDNFHKEFKNVELKSFALEGCASNYSREIQ